MIQPAWSAAIPPAPRGYRGCDDFAGREYTRCRAVIAAVDALSGRSYTMRERFQRLGHRRTAKAPDAARYTSAGRKSRQWRAWTGIAYSRAGYHPNADRSRLQCGAGFRAWGDKTEFDKEGCKNIRDRRVPQVEAFFRRYVDSKPRRIGAY